MEFDLAVIALLVAGYALVAARLDQFSIGPGARVPGHRHRPVRRSARADRHRAQAEPVKALAEVTLTLLLFADASTIRASALRHDAAPVARLLTIGLLLTIAFGTVVALLLFPGTPLGIAVLVGATLAPTDAALGLPVITNPVVPPRIRHLLNIESGLNDGIATPFVILAVALSTAESSGTSSWLPDAVIATAIGVAIGLLLGLTGGWLLAEQIARDGHPRSRASSSCWRLPSGAISSRSAWAVTGSSRHSWVDSPSDAGPGWREESAVQEFTEGAGVPAGDRRVGRLRPDAGRSAPDRLLGSCRDRLTPC